MPTGRLERLRRTLYFRRSMARATVRWVKHVVSFEGGLDYIVQTAEPPRGPGARQLSERERRYPLLFLWGRVFRYLASVRKGARKNE